MDPAIIDTDFLEVQQDLENESRAIGQARYRNNRESRWVDLFGPVKDEGALPPGRQLVRRAAMPTAEAITIFLTEAERGKAGRRHAAFDLLASHSPDPAVLAYLALRCGLQAAASNSRIQKASRMVARAVCDHLEATRFAEINPKGASGLARTNAVRSYISAKRQRAIGEIYGNEGATISWTPQQELQVGLKLLELASEASGLFSLTLVSTKQGKTYKREQQLQVNDAALEWMERQHSRCELLDPLPLPMVVPPRPWTTTTDGGYLTPPIGSCLIRSPSRAYRDEIEHAEMPRVYSAVNAIQQTAWRINRKLLDVLKTAVDSGGIIAGLPRQDVEAPHERPQVSIESSEELAAWKRAAEEAHQRNARAKSKRLELAQCLWVARKLMDFPAIYFPQCLDFRGRMYPIPQGGPHPQAGDVGRSLLEFSEGKPLGPSGIRWLAIHVANVFGNDKVSFEERVAWVRQHSAQIVDSATDPLDGARFWTTADKPWAALAACFEWAGYMERGDDFVSRLPIALDGSNSGLQHFTALLRDPGTAPLVNLVPLDHPGDLYTVVAAKAQAEVNTSNDPRAEAWKGDRIIRRIVKRPCMTYVYSATPAGMADQIRSALAELDEERAERGLQSYLGGADNFRAANWLSHLLYRLIGETVPAARDAMKWLTSLSRVMTKADLPLWWTTPAGLPVLQRYPKKASKKSEVTFRGKRMQLNLEDETGPSTLAAWMAGGQPDGLDAKGNASAIAPNFVHSLDAAHLHLTVNAATMAGIRDLSVIHDSFGTHASETGRLAKILRETFRAMYQADPLGQLYAEALDQLAHLPELAGSLPPPPTPGTFNLGLVGRATYMFA